MNLRRELVAAGLATALSIVSIGPAFSQGTPVATPAVGGVQILGSVTLPNDLVVDETPVGGLSGVDFNPATGQWVAICDDRSDSAPARFYNLNVAYDESGIQTFEVNSAVTLLQPDGSPYPGVEDGGTIPDPESIRFDPLSGDLFYTSEGSFTYQLDPFVAVSDLNGNFVAGLPIDPIFEMDRTEASGPRDNQVFEGLSFSADGKSLWIQMEGPLYQDGPVSTFEAPSSTRLTNIDRAGRVLGQYEVELDALPAEPIDFATTGFTEVLAVDETRFLVLERATVVDAEGIFQNYVKLYEIDIAGATNVAGYETLAGAAVVPATKTLLVDFNASSLDWVDNLEAMTWGPTLANGNRSLLITSDNNFNETQIQQVILLEVPADI